MCGTTWTYFSLRRYQGFMKQIHLDESKAQYFYKVKNGSSNNLSKSSSKNLSNGEVFPENWHFNSCFVLKTTKTPLLAFISEILWKLFDIVSDYLFFTKKLRFTVHFCNSHPTIIYSLLLKTLMEYFNRLLWICPNISWICSFISVRKTISQIISSKCV